MTNGPTRSDRRLRQKFVVVIGAAAIAAGSQFIQGPASGFLLSLATYLAGWLTNWPADKQRDGASSIPPPPKERAADARARHDGDKSSGGNPFGH